MSLDLPLSRREFLRTAGGLVIGFSVMDVASAEAVPLPNLSYMAMPVKSWKSDRRNT
mgnify:CR=1 FL=1